MTDATERLPAGDERPQDHETVDLTAASVARPAAAGSLTGAMATEDSLGIAQPSLELAYESGVEVKARSQWAYARIRFFRHRLALLSLIILILIGIVALAPGVFAPYGYDEIPFTDYEKLIENPNLLAESIDQAPTTKEWHLFGTDQLGRDTLSRVIFGIRPSLSVELFVAILSTAFGQM